MRDSISVDDALSLAMASVRCVDSSERLPLGQVAGRVMAEDVVSKASVPPFHRSVVDGYAVWAGDSEGATRSHPVALRKVDTVHAGATARRKISKGTCAGIATGGMLPKGADAVVMAEDVEIEDGQVLLRARVHRGQNVSAKGEDIKPETRVVAKGEIITPGKVGVLAAIGRNTVRVYSKPLVAIAPTGDEVVELGRKPRVGEVYNINGHTLSAVVEANGGVARRVGIVRDNLVHAERVLSANSDCCMVVFSGGSSVGEKDVVRQAIERRGGILFQGIAMKPGKSTALGRIGRQLVWAMPGRPSACLSSAYVLMVPVLRKAARLPELGREPVSAKMAERIVSPPGSTWIMTVRLERDVAYPTTKGYGIMTGMARADGYVVIPASSGAIGKGERVTVHLF